MIRSLWRCGRSSSGLSLIRASSRSVRNLHFLEKRHAIASLHTSRRFSSADTVDSAAAVNHDSYDDKYIADILKDVEQIFMFGASDNWNRPSYFAMKYLQKKGYRVIPINPIAVKKNVDTILGEKVYESLDDAVDKGGLKVTETTMIDIFRNSEAAVEITKEAITKHGAKIIWMQLGVRNDDVAQFAKDHNARVVMDRCPKIEYSRLYGELGWHGFNTHVISSKRSERKRIQSQVRFSGFDTKSIHAGARPDPVTGARVTPIYQNTSFVFEDCDEAASLFNLQSFGNIYGRLSNPTTAVLEERLAALEGGRGATCTSSGHAAQLLTLFTLMQPGDTLVASNKLYGGSVTQFNKTIKKFDWNCQFVDLGDLDAVKAAVANPTAKALWIESLANPGGIISDLEALADVAHEAELPLIVDNTMATPFLCQPFRHGADLVVHSTTKFLSGHGNAMGGCVIDKGTFDWGKVKGKYPSLSMPEPAYHNLTFFETFGDLAFTVFGHAVGLRDLGSTMAPMNAFLTINGIETLSLRMQKHVQNAKRIALHLRDHPKVSWVSYAGLETSPYFDLHQRYMPNGAGSVFTFGVVGGYDNGIKVVENCNLISHLANIGDTRSLILHPASTTHRQLTAEQQVCAGAGPDVLRLSVGIESVEDIISDLDNALKSI